MSSVKILKGFDKSQLFRFFVDGRFHKKYKGWRGYEDKEKGSIQALLNGFSFALDNFDLSNGVKSEYILKLHKICLTNVSAKVDKSIPGELRYLDGGMAIFAGETTLEGLKEIFKIRSNDGTILFHTTELKKTAEQLNFVDIYNKIKIEGKIRYRPWYPIISKEMEKALEYKGNLSDFYEAKNYVQLQFAKKIDSIVESFNKAIKNTKNEEDKILTISIFIRDLELLHPFADGNCRVFACILLNHLLLYNNLFPAILYNPNRDGEFSYKQFAQEIKIGIENTKLLLINPNTKLYDYNIEEMDVSDKNLFLDMAKDLIFKINNFKDVTLNDTNNIFIDYFMLKKLSNSFAYNIKTENIYFTNVVAAYNDVREGSLYFMTNMPAWIKSGNNPTDVIEKIYKKGAKLIVIDKKEYLNKCSAPVLVVDDVLKFMKQASSFVRNIINPKRVFITGTVGKTGFKFQLNHLVSKQLKSHIRQDSGNMEVSICTSILSLRQTDEVEITEVAVGLGGVAEPRSAIVNPDICIFTEIGECHMDGHKTMENLVLHKASVVNGMKDDGICIINANSDYAYNVKIEILKQKNVQIEFFGENSISDAAIIDAEFDKNNLLWNIYARIEDVFVRYQLPLINEHAPLVSTGVLLAAKKLGLDLIKACKDYATFEQYETMGRIHNIKTSRGSFMLYDQSRRGAIQGFKSAFSDFMRITSPNKGRKVAIIAGTSIYNDTQWTKNQHTELASLINKAKISHLYTIGEYMNYVHDNINEKVQLVAHTDSYSDIEKIVINDIKDKDQIIIMGHGRHNLENLAKKILKLGSLNELV